jgi:hypothetical protein
LCAEPFEGINVRIVACGTKGSGETHKNKINQGGRYETQLCPCGVSTSNDLHRESAPNAGLHRSVLHRFSLGKLGLYVQRTVFAPNPLPVAAVGHAHLDSSGNVAGTQSHTLAGQTEVEDISGTYKVNKDCTGSMTVNVSLNGQLLRTATVNVAYDTDVNHA